MCHYRPVSFLITTGSKYHLPKSPPPKHGTLFSFSITVKNKKNYQFWVSLLWISHLQFWCTEGKLVPTSNLPLQSGSSLPIHPFQPTWSLLSFSPLVDSGSGLPEADLLKLPFHLYLLCFPWKQSNLARVYTWRNHTLRTQVQIPKQKNEIDNLILPMSSKPLMTHQQAPSMPASTEKKTKRKELGVGPICLWVQQPSVKNTTGGKKMSSSYTPLSLKSTAKHSWPKSTPREGYLKCTYYRIWHHNVGAYRACPHTNTLLHGVQTTHSDTTMWVPVGALPAHWHTTTWGMEHQQTGKLADTALYGTSTSQQL